MLENELLNELDASDGESLSEALRDFVEGEILSLELVRLLCRRLGSTPPKLNRNASSGN